MRTDKYMMAKAWMKQDQAPQAEALETWNTLEAEFNEERKAMLMASAETDAIKEAMNKKFGSGTVKYGSEIKQPEIKTPQAIFEFSQRNPAAEGGRMGFSKGLSVPKYPDLRQFGAYESPAKTKLLNDFKKKLKKYLLQEIKNFKKTALPKEKYQLVKDNIYRAMGYNPNEGKKPSKTLIKYVKETIDTLPKNNTWELNTTGKGQLASSVDRSNPIPENIKNRTKDFFRKNYKNLNISQMAERLTNTISGHPLHAAVKENLNRYKNFLIEKNVIKDADLSKGVGGAEEVKKLPPKAYADYRKEYTDLAKKAGIADDPQFFATKGKSKGKFGYWKFDDYMKNTMLNMDKIRATLSPDFPTMLLPSFEHTMGVKPGLITGDTSALKKVELQTKKYNFGAIDGMGARSADFRRVQANLKSATKELKAGNLDAANTSLAKVNEIYDNVAEKFNINRKGLPNYNVDGKNIFESNIKEVSKAEKPNKSMFNFFEKVANQASKKEMKVIKKSDPKVFDVLTEFQGEGNSKKIREMIKVIGCPNFKAAGGRIEFESGGDCFDKGQKLINSGMKGASNASLKNLAKLGPMLLKAGSAAMSGLIVPEAVIVGLETAARVGMGDTPSEAILRATDYLTPDSFFGDFMQKADLMKIERTLGKDVKNIAAQSFDRTNQSDEINKLEEKLKNLEAMTESGDFGYVGDLTNQINMTKNQIKEKKDKLKNTAQIGQEGRDFYTQQAMENAYDASMAKSKFAEKRLVDSQSENPRLSAEQAMQDIRSQEQLNKGLSMRSPLTGSEGETAFLKLSQLPTGPRMPSEIDMLAANVNKKFKNMGSDKRVTSQDLKFNQDRKQMFKDASIEELVNMGLPLEAILGFNIAQPVERTGPGYKTNYKPLDRFGSQERPVLYPNNRGTLAEGGITQLRSKYEYKK